MPIKVAIPYGGFQSYILLYIFIYSTLKLNTKSLTMCHYDITQEYNAAVQSSCLPQVLQSICEHLHSHTGVLQSTTLAHAIETSSNLLSRAQPSTVTQTDAMYHTPERELYI